MRWVLGAAAFTGAAVFLRAGVGVLPDVDGWFLSATGVSGVVVLEVMFMADEFLKLTVYTVYAVDPKMTSQLIGTEEIALHRD